MLKYTDTPTVGLCNSPFGFQQGIAYYYNHDQILAEQRSAEKRRGEIVQEIEASPLELYADPNLRHKPKPLEKRGGAHYSTVAVAVISAIHHDKGEVHIANTLNNGALPNLPPHCVVELPSVIIGKMILRLISISSGSIVVDGVDVSTLKGKALKEYHRSVQGVFQDPFSSYNPIFKADRVFRTIKEEFFPHIAGPEGNDKVQGSLRAVGLNPDQVLNKFPHQLSGGQLQRFLIARALLLDIQFLVADEIISMLDASTRIDVLNLLADLKSRGLSVLFITHALSLGYYISERAVILYSGCVAEMGATEKIYNSPRHPYTKMIMASVPRLDKKWEEVDIELKAKQSELTSGCVYYDRCPAAGKDEGCASDRPKLVEVEPDHFVACCVYD